jgi:hypothetical protein
VPPIFQPEVAAEAIVWASEHRRREVWVGGSTYGVIVGGFLGPVVADRYLARTNIDDQQTDLPIDPDRPHYLYEPVPGDLGAHGIFDGQAKPRSVAWALSRRRRSIGLGALAAAGAGARLWWRHG